MSRRIGLFRVRTAWASTSTLMSDWNNQSGGETECSASLETLEHVLLPRLQLVLAVLDVGDRAVAVML